MRAMVVTRYGPPEVFEQREVPDLEPQPDHVLIRNKAVGINFADLLQRMGLYPGTPKPPFIPGLEIAGVVERVASPAGSQRTEGERVAPGDRVAALTSFNAYAELVAVPARRVFRLPATIPFEDAAALPVNYLTAYHAMFQMGNLQAGDRILIHGAAGGVGVAAVQLAKTRRLEIFGTAGPAKQEFLRQSGVHHPIDYSTQDFVEVVRRAAPQGIEMAMDPIGGKSFSQSYQCLGSTGRLVVYGFSAAAGPEGGSRWSLGNLWRGVKALLETPRFHPLKLTQRNISIMGVHLGRMEERTPLLRRELNELLQMYAAGQIRPVIGKSFPLAQAGEAHRYIHNRQNIGKVILLVG